MSEEETGKATESYVTELHIFTRHEMLLGWWIKGHVACMGNIRTENIISVGKYQEQIRAKMGRE